MSGSKGTLSFSHTAGKEKPRKGAMAASVYPHGHFFN
jgi:hypothetical protein